MRLARRSLTLACLVAALAFSGQAQGAPTLPLGHAGRWTTDAGGRVVVIHGINMVYKLAPFYPSAIGFGDDDAAFLQSIGFNAVRVGVLWQAVEPQPGVYDDAYLNQIQSTVTTLARHGIVSLLDFHQDLYSQEFQGEGFPAWSVQDGGLANPKLGFPGNYLANPATQHAFDSFWANSAGPGGVGLQDRYAAAWQHVAQHFRNDRDVLGYELMNEPWPGTDWQQCASPPGCPMFDATMAQFIRRTLAAIRTVDPHTLVWYEPNVLFNYGANTNLPKFADPQLGFAFHNYCLPAPSSGTSQACDTSDDLVFSNAVAHATNTGDALLETEFGATDNTAFLTDSVQRADRNMVGWLEWAYCGCSDPTTTGAGTKEAIVVDPAKPPTGSNLELPTLHALVEPYPQLVSGTPQSWGFATAAQKFSFAYTTRRASGAGSFPAGAVTEIATPALVYPHGYAAQAHGAAVVSPRKAGTLLVAACRGSSSVTVTATPTGPSGGSCRAKLVVSITPGSASLRHPTTFRFSVLALLGSYRQPLAGATVYFGQHRAHTNGRGRATIRVTLHRHLRRYGAVARASGFTAGKAFIKVR